MNSNSFHEIVDIVVIITLNRPKVRNAIDRDTADELSNVFQQFDANKNLKVAILTEPGQFCSGVLIYWQLQRMDIAKTGLNPNIKDNGPSWTNAHVAFKACYCSNIRVCSGRGLELACWCDIRMADMTAKFGVFCRRFGVPLIDGGTQRLPRLIGLSRALDLIITGREINAEEAYQFGLVNYLVTDKDIKQAALELAHKIASFPQQCMRSDRMSVYKGFNMPLSEALEIEFARGTDVIRNGETLEGAKLFAQQKGNKI